MNIQTVKNVSDCVPLYLPHSLYLKPHAKMVISVQLPTTITGKSISNWDVMENLRNIISPDKFSVLKVTKSTLELTRLDAELDDRERLKPVLQRLDGNSVKLNGFSESARIRASETKDNFPKRHDWDSYFRDARNMDEKKPGERPDTIHISNLPIRWFCPRHMENEDDVKPSESIFKRIFEKFGPVRCVDIPICDVYRKDMKSHMTGMKTFSFDQELYFEGYVQFSEYIGFVRTMDALRGMKLLRKDGEKNLAISIAVDFDTTKHLSEANIKRRQVIRDRLIMKENEKREEERRKAEEEEKQKEKERQKIEQQKLEEYEKQRQREEKRKEKQLKKIREQEQHQLNSKIRSEEKKLLIAQRKLESIRVLEALFDRIKLKNETLKAKIKKERDEIGSRDKHNSQATSSLKRNPFDLRNKLISKVKSASEQELERQKNRLKKYRSGMILNRGSRERSPSVNSISSCDSILSDKETRKKRKKDSDKSQEEKEKEENHGPLMPGMGAYPMYNPETGQWLGMYPYPAPFFPPIYPPAAMPYEMAPRGGYRGRFPRSRGRRGGYRGARLNHYGDDRRNDDWYDHKRRRDHHRRSDSGSRSRSRSYSSRSRSHSRNRRSRRSRSHSSSRSNSETKLQAEHRSKKLASTLRRSRSSSSSSSRRSRSRSRSHSRSRKRSQTTKKRSQTSKKRHHSKDGRSNSRDRNSSTKRDKSTSERKKRHATRTPSPRKAKSKSPDREKLPRTPSAKRSPSPPRKMSKSRSKSIDSSAFQSPKHKAKSVTPEKEWD